MSIKGIGGYHHATYLPSNGYMKEEKIISDSKDNKENDFKKLLKEARQTQKVSSIRK